MAEAERGPRLFTVEEANRLLPEVGLLLHRLRACRERIRVMEQRRAVEELSWLREDGAVSPKAQKEVARIDQAIEGGALEFKKELETLNRIGVQLKDLEEGLVDFFAVRGERLIYLCWKEGEGRIGYWHDMDSGYAGRQLL